MAVWWWLFFHLTGFGSLFVKISVSQIFIYIRCTILDILITSQPDTELVERLRQGNIEAFDTIYAKYASKLFSFGFYYLKSSEEAEELVQSVFLKVWENCKELKKELSFKSYIFTIAYSEICKIFRKRSYWKKFTEDYMMQDLHEPSSAFIEEDISIQQVLKRIQQIIDKLPEKQRYAFVKSKIEGKSAKEVAKDLNLSPGTVDNYVSEVLKYIRSHIDNRDIAMILFFSIFFS